MSQLVKFNSAPSLLSFFENFWGNDLANVTIPKAQEKVSEKKKIPLN